MVSRPFALGACACVTSLLAFGCSSSTTSRPSTSAPAPRPNIVFALTDDLDLTSYTTDQVRFPKFHALMTTQGTTFSNAFVTDSLCCPSRASILRGQYVHDHGVLDNLPPEGGFEHWQELGRDTSTVATWLHAAGYRTALFGKYLNGYPDTVARSYVPPGWDEWASPNGGNPYSEYNYRLNENGRTRAYGSAPDDYLVDVLAKKSTAFIDRYAGKQPFFLYVAPYVPHQPATPAPRYAKRFPKVAAPRTASFDQRDVSAEPAYIRNRPRLAAAVVRYIDQLYRRRLQSMLGVEDMLSGIVDALARAHQLDNTYIVFTSDNGFHLGQHRLPFGKQTPFEEDIHVPLVVRGPGIEANRDTAAFAREIDFAPTFAEWAHAETPDFVDGVSLVPRLAASRSAGAPADLLVEHYANGNRALRATGSNDPDDDANAPTDTLRRLRRALVAVSIPPYRALRTARYTYVEYSTGEKQLFDLSTDPDELHDIAATAAASLLSRLSSRLAHLATCSGRSCRE